jgi:large subunit ribosomal protein L9
VSVLLRKPYDNLGYSGQEVVVSPGLSRNFLIPQGIAVYATEANRALYKVVLEGDALRKSESERAHRLLLARVANIVLIFQKATKEDGTLYSPVTASDIAAKLESTPLKNLGVQERNVRVGKKIDIPGEFEVHIEAVKASPGTFLPLKVRVGVAV